MQAASGLVELEKDKRWRRANLEEFQSLDSTSVVHQQLLRLEEAQLSGHWLECKMIHEDLLQKALLGMAFEESHEHLESVISIVRKEAITEREITELATRRNFFDRIQKLTDLGQNFDAAVRGGDVRETEIIG